MTPEILALLSTGATTLVAAAATDAWAVARPGFVRLFGRGDSTREAETARRLDTLAAAVEQAPTELRRETRAQQQPEWLTRLRDLAEDDPDMIARLRTLVDQLTAQLPAQESTQTQNIISDGHGRSFGVQNGTFTYHEHPRSAEN